MGSYINILTLIIIGIILLSFGTFLFFGPPSPFYPYMPWAKKKHRKQTNDSQFCPVCLYKIFRGELVKTIAFPKKANSSDCLMHIKGCVNCLENNKPRQCPICKADLSVDDFLVARMFERRGQKNHVHVLGCSRCRKV